MSVPLQICSGTDKCSKPEISILFGLLSFFYLIFSLPSQNLSLSLSQVPKNPNSFFLFSQSDASKKKATQKKAAATAKRGGKAAATSSKSAAAAASDSQNEVDLIFDF